MRKKVVGLSFAVLFVISSLAAVPASAVGVEWSDPLLIGAGGLPSQYEPSMASNDQGWIIAAWTADDGTQSIVYANRFSPEIGWAGAEAIGTGYEVVVGIDDAGNSTVAWTDRATIMATRYVPTNSAWDPVSPIPGSESYIYRLRLSVCGNGGAVVAWRQWGGEDTGVYASIRDAGSTWGNAVLIHYEGYLGDSPVAMDDNRNAIVVYTADDGTKRSVWARHYTHGQGWGSAIIIESQIGYSSYSPNLGMNGEGLAIAVWMSRVETGYSMLANVYKPELGWEGENQIEVPDASRLGLPTIAIDEAGDAVATWEMALPGESYGYVRANLYEVASGWSGPTTICDVAEAVWSTQPCAVTEGGVYVAWRIWDWANDTMGIRANHYNDYDGWTGVSTVAECENLTDPAITPNHLGGVTIAWAGLYADWGVYVSSCSGSGPVSEDPVAVVDVSEGRDWRIWKFDGRESSDDGRIVDYMWDFGDGSYAYTKVAWNTYQKAGDYTVTLTVWDDEGNSDSTSITLSVRPNPG